MAAAVPQKMKDYLGRRVRERTDRIIDKRINSFSERVGQTQLDLQNAAVYRTDPNMQGGKRNYGKLYTKKDKKKIDGVVKVIYSKKKSQKLYVKSKGKMMNLVKYKKMKQKTKNKKQKNKK